MTPSENQPTGYLIVCTSHGELTDEPAADETAADLVAREHSEDCTAEVVVAPEGSTEYRLASDLADMEDVQGQLPEGS